MKLLKYLLIVLGSLLVIFLLAGVWYPQVLRVERSRVIAASEGELKAALTDLHRYEAWWPWTSEGAGAEYRYQGDIGEKGSRMEWEGGTEFGSGTVTLEQLGEPFILRIHFKEPHESEIRSRFSMKSLDEGRTKLRWRVEEELSWPTNAIPHFMNVDERLGARFEKGLERLAQAVKED